MLKIFLALYFFTFSILISLVHSGVVSTTSCAPGGLFEELTVEGCSGEFCQLEALLVSPNPPTYQWKGYREVTIAFSPNKIIRGGYTTIGGDIFKVYTCDRITCPLKESDQVSYRLKFEYNFYSNQETVQLPIKIIGADDSIQVCQNLTITRLV